MGEKSKLFLAGIEGEQVHWLTAPSMVKLREVISFSREESLKLNHNYISIEHLLLGLTRDEQGPATKTLRNLGVDPVMLRKTVESSISNEHGKANSTMNNFPLTKSAENVLKMAVLEARMTMKNNAIGPEHLMLSILKNKNNLATQLLNQYDIDYEVFKAELMIIQ